MIISKLLHGPSIKMAKYIENTIVNNEACVYRGNKIEEELSMPTVVGYKKLSGRTPFENAT
jgi:hypothetical protein